MDRGIRVPHFCPAVSMAGQVTSQLSGGGGDETDIGNGGNGADDGMIVVLNWPDHYRWGR